MQITLKPALEKFLREKIAQGQYKTLDEAINQGIELLKNRDEIYQGRFEQLQREIVLGAVAAEKGELIDSEVVFERLQQKLANQRALEQNE
jgi:antitoxin ParD1/3/4